MEAKQAFIMLYDRLFLFLTEVLEWQSDNNLLLVRHLHHLRLKDILKHVTNSQQLCDGLCFKFELKIAVDTTEDLA